MQQAPVPYTIRESTRARRVTLRVSARKGVEVVVPRGFDTGFVPDIVAERADWIRKHVDRLREKGWSSEQPERPEALPLRCMGREVVLSTAYRDGKAPVLRERGPDALLLSGDTHDDEACRKLVLQWLKTQARLHLVPMLRALADEFSLSFERAQVRAQAARWGSCSARGTISLNCKILFLPPHLARHVLLHELAHTRHLDHSSSFWSTLATLDPHTETLDTALNDAWRYVPMWLA